jgi:cation diffusion facilitator CzcD-associated flavoprotein CzcO
MNNPIEELDILVIGAGFSGLYQLYLLRNLGYKVKVVEAGGGLGGIWYWSSYPGARVDTDVPLYEFSLEELWKEFTWSERYPSRDEILKYFEFVDKKLDLRKDIYLHTQVISAAFDINTNRWIVQTEKGREFKAQFLVLCVGIGAKTYLPNFEGMNEFKGVCHHSNNFPLKVYFHSYFLL